MTISPDVDKILNKIKQTTKGYCICPICKEKIEIGIEASAIRKLNSESYFPYPHLHIHKDHALVCYIDKDLHIRSFEPIKSVEISRDSETFQNLVKKWSNPY